MYNNLMLLTVLLNLLMNLFAVCCYLCRDIFVGQSSLRRISILWGIYDIGFFQCQNKHSKINFKKFGQLSSVWTAQYEFKSSACLVERNTSKDQLLLEGFVAQWLNHRPRNLLLANQHDWLFINGQIEICEEIWVGWGFNLTKQSL